VDNLVFLCFDHHDEYDSRTSQGKGLTAGEVSFFRDELLASIENTWKEAKPFDITPLIDITDISGHYVWEAGNSTAELDIRATSHDEIEVSGLAFWGTNSPYGPNIGQLDFKASLSNNAVAYVDPNSGYEMHILFTHKGLSVKEKNIAGQFGMNVSFGGDFVRSEKINEHHAGGAAFAFEVFARDGNIFLKGQADEKQLTFWGLDKSPFLLDNGKILFIRQEEALSHGHRMPSVPNVYYTHQLIILDPKTTFEKIITNQKPYEDGNDGSSKILNMRTPTLSADQNFLYFVTEKYVTASQFVKVNINTGEWVELFSAESFELVLMGDGEPLFLVAVSEVRNRGRDIYYKLCDETGRVLKEFDNQENMLRYKATLPENNR